MNPKKRILSILLGVLLMLSILPTVSLADDAAAPTISFVLADPDAVINPGDTFAVNMVIANNPGIAAFQARIDFDKDAMDLTNIVAKTDDATFLLNQGNFIPATDMGYVEPGKGTNFGWMDATGISADGILCQLQFKAKEDAAEGNYSVALDTTNDFDLTGSDDDMTAITPNTTPCTFYLGTPSYGIFARSGEEGAYKYTEVTDTTFMLNTSSNLEVAPWKDTATLVFMKGGKAVEDAQWTINDNNIVWKDKDAAEEVGVIHLKANGSTPGDTTKLTVTSGNTTKTCDVKIANYARAITDASVALPYGSISVAEDGTYIVSSSRTIDPSVPMTDVAGNAIEDVANAGEITWISSSTSTTGNRITVTEDGKLQFDVVRGFYFSKLTATPVVKGYVDGEAVEIKGTALSFALGDRLAEAIALKNADGNPVERTYEVDGVKYPYYIIPADSEIKRVSLISLPTTATGNLRLDRATSDDEDTLDASTTGSGETALLSLRGKKASETPIRVAVKYYDTSVYSRRTDYIYVLVREPLLATEIAMDQAEATVVQTRQITLTVTQTPADNDYPALTWDSEDKTIATVDANGVVTGVAPGETNITATNTKSGAKTTCKVTVTAVDYSGAKLCIRYGNDGEWQELNLTEDQELVLTRVSSTYNVCDTAISWDATAQLGVKLADGKLARELTAKVDLTSSAGSAPFTTSFNKTTGVLTLSQANTSYGSTGTGTLTITLPDDMGTFTVKVRRTDLPNCFGTTWNFRNQHSNDFSFMMTNINNDSYMLIVPDGFVIDTSSDFCYSSTANTVAGFAPSYFPNATIQWTSDDASVASVDGDKITFHKGETQLHLTVSAFCNGRSVSQTFPPVRVFAGEYPTGAKAQIGGKDLPVNDSYMESGVVQKISTIYVGAGKDVTVDITSLPEGFVDDMTVTKVDLFDDGKTSSDIVTVEKGEGNTVVIHGVKASAQRQTLSYTVQLKTPENWKGENTKFNYLYVKVVNSVINPTGLELADVVVQENDTEEATPVFTPATTTDKAVVWSIEDETIATVDEDGLVSGLKEGETTLTCTSAAFPDITATCKVIVTFNTTGYTMAARGTSENGEAVYNAIGETNPLILNTRTVEPWKSTAELYLLNDKGEICEDVEWTIPEGSELRQAETQPETRGGFAIDATGLADGTKTEVNVTRRGVTFTCPVQVKDYYFTATSVPSFDIAAQWIGQVQGKDLFSASGVNAFTFTLKDELTAAQKAAQTLEFVPSVEGAGTSTANSDGTYTFTIANGEYDFTLNIHAIGSRDGAPYSASLSSAAAFNCHVGANVPAMMDFQQKNVNGTFVGLYSFRTVSINNLVNSKLCKVTGRAYEAQITQGESSEFNIAANPETAQSQMTINSIVSSSSDMTVERTGDYGFTITVSETAKVGDIGYVTVTGTRVINGKTVTFRQPMYVKAKDGSSVESISLETSSAYIEVGDTTQLTAVIKPKLAANTTLTWKSSKPEVASVDENGLVTGLGAGSVQITATAPNGKSGYKFIYVKAKGTAKAVLSTNLEDGAKLKPGDTFHLYVDLENVPEGGFDVITAKVRPTAWKNTAYFTAETGSTENLLGSGMEGYAPTLTYNQIGTKATATWMAIMELDMSASESNITGDGRLMDILVTVGEDAQQATDTTYEFNTTISGWSCDGTKISNSYVVRTSITVEGGKPASAPTGVTIGSDSASNVACVDDTITLAANVAPAGASQTVVWSTDDTDIISIASADEIATNSMEVTANKIKVTALKEGTATITATAGTVSATYTLTIVEKQIGLTAAIDGTQTIDKGETANVRVRIDSDNAEETYNAFELIVSYDSDKLTYVGSDVDASANRFVKDNGDGTLTIYGYGDSITAGTELATLQFTGTAAGKANVALTSAKANESDVAIKDDLQTINISATQKTAVVTIVDAVTVTFEGGTVNGGKTKLLVENGELSFTVDPVEGKDVQSVLVNGAALQPNAQGVYELSGVTEDTTVTINFKAKTYTVEFTGNGKDDAEGEPTATHGETYGFTLNEQAGYKYDIKVTVDGQELSDVTGTSIPGRYVTGNIVIEITKTAISVNDYSVKIWRNGVEQTGEETTVTQNANEYKFQYDAAKWKLMKVTMGGTEVAVADDNGSVTVNGPITGNLAIYYAGIYKVTLPEAGVNADKDSAIYGEDFTFTVDDGYTLTEVTINGKKYEVTPNEDGSYTIKGEDITGDVVITVDVPKYQVEVYEYVKLENKASVMLIVAKADLAEGKALYYDGNMMFHSNADAYDGYAYLQIIGEGETLTKEEAAKKITQSAGTPVEIDYSGNVNMSASNIIDLNDAQLAYDIYMAKYNSLDGQVSMEKFLRADVNVDHCVDATDARAIADDVYQK